MIGLVKMIRLTDAILMCALAPFKLLNGIKLVYRFNLIESYGTIVICCVNIFFFNGVKLGA